nr:hypothetical protein GCM10025732_39190 [Glycomyces mayteni]
MVAKFAKYWLKFSSPERIVPHGVVPPAQLFSVPSAVAPSASAVVLSRSEPAAGPEITNGVSAVMRRLSPSPTTGVRAPVRRSSSTVTTDRPCAARPMRIWSSVGAASS